MSLLADTPSPHLFSVVCLFSDSDLILTTAWYAVSYLNIINPSSMSALYKHALVIGHQIRVHFVYCVIRIMSPHVSCMFNILYLLDHLF